jgi:hypothetical protein
MLNGSDGPREIDLRLMVVDREGTSESQRRMPPGLGGVRTDASRYVTP